MILKRFVPERRPSSGEMLVTACCDPGELQGSHLESLFIGSETIDFCQVERVQEKRNKRIWLTNLNDDGDAERSDSVQNSLQIQIYIWPLMTWCKMPRFYEAQH
ncbi:hypothetical protein GRJ2_000056000 [Grus japonensis]|uniref:Uncharacterized protein n=1 Tax=Grus japonensis TaxID=30415 RepID=A0ABC9VRY6_GRUJA